MLLENKVAIIYGAGGAIGGAAARAFAREGARVYLAGRTAAKLEAVAQDIRAQGGTAQPTALDALDEPAVQAYVDHIAAESGRVDISFNAIGLDDVQQPLMAISLSDFLQPITTAMRTQFLTTRAAAPHMIRQKAGVILAFGGNGPQTVAGLGGFKVALDAIEGLRRQWATELGEHGIRVITLKSGGITETISPEMEGGAEIVKSLVDATLLKRAATLADVGNVAAFLASDLARTITGTEINISCGAMLD